jgi:hypothetical protein
MDESIVVKFRQSGEPLRVTSLTRDEGLTFEEPQDASPLNVGLGLQPLQPVRVAAVQKRHGWTGTEFGFDARLLDGAIAFSGASGDRDGLPPGPYDVTFELESYAFKNPHNRVVVKAGSKATIVLDVKPELRRIELRDNFDTATGTLIAASELDGKTMAAWLAGAVRPVPRV